MQRVYDFLKEAGTYYLATDENGQPRVRPFGTIDLFEGKLYIQTGLKKPTAQQMLANPNIEICAFHKGKWIRVAAKAVHDPRVEAQQHMLDGYPSLQAMYRAGDGNTAVFALTEATATISSFTEEPVVINF